MLTCLTILWFVTAVKLPVLLQSRVVPVKKTCYLAAAIAMHTWSCEKKSNTHTVRCSVHVLAIWGEGRWPWNIHCMAKQKLGLWVRLLVVKCYENAEGKIWNSWKKHFLPQKIVNTHTTLFLICNYQEIIFCKSTLTNIIITWVAFDSYAKKPSTCATMTYTIIAREVYNWTPPLIPLLPSTTNIREIMRYRL